MIVIPLIFALRIFGFMAVLPVAAIATKTYSGYSIAMVGLVIGIYGLMQAMLHIPMGYLSDRYGRRNIVLLGLFLMLLGSVFAAITTSIYGLVIARAIQGAGAVGSVLNAWCADLTAESERTKAMAIIGMTIGATFLMAVVLGPVIFNAIGFSGLFWLTAFLALIAMALTLTLPQGSESQAIAFKSHFNKIIRDSNIHKLNFGIFAVHASYTALFLLIPGWVAAYVGGTKYAWHLYLPMILTGALLSLPMMFFAEARGYLRQVLWCSAIMFLLVHLGLIVNLSWWLPLLFLYFSAFTILEALLPSLLSRFAPAGCKGTAMGAFACAQYLGIFVGSVFGGWLLHNFSIITVLIFIFLISTLWCLMALKLPVANLSR